MKKIRYILLVVVIILLAAIDQITKYFVIKNIPLHNEVPVIGDIFVLSHIQNSGSAWGVLSGKIVFLLIITAIVTFGLLYIFHNIAGEEKYMPIRVCIALILGGALGNLIDRVRFGYVTDFLYFKLINFPVFNFADICVTVSIFVLLFLFIFKYKEADLDKIISFK